MPNTYSGFYLLQKNYTTTTKIVDMFVVTLVLVFIKIIFLGWQVWHLHGKYQCEGSWIQCTSGWVKEYTTDKDLFLGFCHWDIFVCCFHVCLLFDFACLFWTLENLKNIFLLRRCDFKFADLNILLQEYKLIGEF